MRMIRPLRVDFQCSHAAPISWIGAALLAIGTLLGIGTLWQYEALADEIAAWENKIDEVKGIARRAPGSIKESTRDPQDKLEAVRFANAVLDQLSVPWARLFAEIEAAADERTALLSVEPDPRSHVVRISGEAKDFAAVLGYARRLEETPVLEKVYLAEHEIQTQDPNKPVAFALSALWVTPP